MAPGPTSFFAGERIDWSKRGSMLMTKRTIVILILVVTIITSVVALYWYKRRNQIASQQTVRIGIANWPGFASGMVGDERNLFNGVKLHYTVADNQPARYAAFQNGNFDIL